MDLEQFKQATSGASWLSTGNPGCTATLGTVRYLALCCLYYCEGHRDEVNLVGDSMTILDGQSEDSVERYVRMGRAFAAVADRNMGNKYATLIIAEMLQWFSEKAVTTEQAELLKLLEEFMIASGDARKSEEGDT